MQSPASRQFILGQNLQQQSLDTSPIYSNTQGFAQLAKALAGGLLQRDAQTKYADEQKAKSARMAQALQGIVPAEFIPALTSPDPNAGAIATVALQNEREAAREKARDNRVAASAIELEAERGNNARALALAQSTANRVLNEANNDSREKIADLNREANAAMQKARLAQEQGNFKEANRLKKEAAELARKHDEDLETLKAKLGSVASEIVEGTGDNDVPVGATAVKTTDARGNVTFDRPIYPPSSAEERVISILNEYERLAENDPDILNQPEYKNYKTMFDKYTRAQGQPGIALTIGKDGSVSLQTGDQSAAASGLPATRVVAEGKGLGQRTTAIDSLEGILRFIEKDPSKFGVTGALQSLTQEIGGVLQDLDPTDVSQAIKSEIAEFYPDDVRAQKNFDPFFDPKLPKSEIAINSIAFRIAADRISVGDGVRSLASEFERVQKSLSLRGLRSSANVKARLQQALEELQSTQANVQKALGQRTGQTPGTSGETVRQPLVVPYEETQ